VLEPVLEHQVSRGSTTHFGLESLQSTTNKVIIEYEI